jgi:hypothetical protein
MHSKNKKSMTVIEREHVTLVKQTDCAVCDAPGPTEAHEIEQGLWMVSIGLCVSCHRDEHMGWHGRRKAWEIYKVTPVQALNVTLTRVAQLRRES